MIRESMNRPESQRKIECSDVQEGLRFDSYRAGLKKAVIDHRLRGQPREWRQPQALVYKTVPRETLDAEYESAFRPKKTVGAGRLHRILIKGVLTMNQIARLTSRPRDLNRRGTEEGVRAITKTFRGVSGRRLPASRSSTADASGQEAGALTTQWRFTPTSETSSGLSVTPKAAPVSNIPADIHGSASMQRLS